MFSRSSKIVLPLYIACIDKDVYQSPAGIEQMLYRSRVERNDRASTGFLFYESQKTSFNTSYFPGPPFTNMV